LKGSPMDVLSRPYVPFTPLHNHLFQTYSASMPT
jgi:hypothetical protein